MVLIGAMINSFSMVVLRLMRGFITNDIVLQYFYLGQIFTNGLMMSDEGNTSLHQAPLDWSFVGLIALLVLFAYIGQVTVTRSVFLLPPSSVMPFTYILVVVSFTIDVLVF